MRQWNTPGTLADRALADPDVVLFAAQVSVWGRWFIWLVGIYQLTFPPHLWYPDDSGYLATPVVLFLANGLVHYRLLTNKTVTWRWMLYLAAVDVALITSNVVIGGGYSSFIFLAYYPALAVLAVILSSVWLNLACATVAAVTYATVCLVTGDGVDVDAGNDKVLVARLALLYVIVLGINVITRFERKRWRTAMARERQLRHERIEVSRTIHDTSAQTAYMISLGIHRARQLAGDADVELAATLDATSELSRSAMWEMRGPIDAGHIVEGRELARVLWSHCSTFERITAVPTEMSQSGSEPALPVETRSRLFSIAHNALTNAFLHAHPRRVEVRLSFERSRIRLSVSDDGMGLPEGYGEHGRGFSGMRADAEHLGGALTVESAGPGTGTTITCAVPLESI